MIYTRNPRTQQPQNNIGVNWGNPITRGLVFCYIPTIPFDLTSVGSALTSSATSKVGTPFGIGDLVSAGVDGAGVTLVASPIAVGATKCTFASYAAPTSSFRRNIMLSQAGNDSGYHNQIQLLEDFGNLGANPGTLNFFSYTGGTGWLFNATTSSSSVVDGLPHVYMGIRDYGASRLELYRDGVSLALTGVLDAGTGLPSDIYRVRVGNDAENGTGITDRNCSGPIGLSCIWNRALTPAEARSFGNNPWQLFAPTQRRIWSQNIWEPPASKLITTRSPRTQQPQNITQLNPNLRSPAAVWVASIPNTELVSKNPVTNNGTTLGVSSLGVTGRIYNTLNCKFTLANNADVLLPLNEQFTCAIVRKSIDTSPRDSTLFGYHTGALRLLAHAPYSDGMLYFDYANSNAGEGRVSVSFAKSTNVESLIFVRRGQFQGVYRNGALIVGATQAPRTRNQLGAPFNIGAASNALYGDEEEIILAVVASAGWTDIECRKWSANPFGETFIPTPRRSYSLHTAGKYYYYIIQDSSKPDPSAQQIVQGLDGSGAAALALGNVQGPVSGTDPIYSAPTATGLSQGANYEEFWTYYDNINYSPVAKVTFQTTVTVQLLRPASDISAGAWTPSTGTTLYETLDETPYNDTDYILTASASTAEVKFGTGETPEAGDFIVRYRAKNNGSGALTVYLYQGATLKATHNPTLTSSYQTFTWTLSGGEAASITDFTDLRIKFTSS